MLLNCKAVKTYARAIRKERSPESNMRVSADFCNQIDRHVADLIEAAVKANGSRRTLRGAAVTMALLKGV